MGKLRCFFVFIALACSQLFQQSCNEPGLPLPDSELRSPGADGLAAVMNEAGLAHPQFINANNELLITYSINGYGNFDPDQPPCVETCIAGRMDPDITYRPRGIRVPLKLIDPAF